MEKKLINKKIENTIARLRVIREDRQLTDGLRKALDGAIEELEHTAVACEGEADADRRKQIICRALRRIGWWIALQSFDWPNGSDPEC